MVISMNFVDSRTTGTLWKDHFRFSFLRFVMAVRVTAKGQVTIPKRIRDLLGIQAGSKVAFTLAEDGRVNLSKIDKESASGGQPNRFAVLRGSSSSGMSTEEIMALTRGDN
jgi:AbrB family looped-hinge helix DNA binding protein